MLDNAYILEQLVLIRLAEARAVAQRAALIRAASGARAPRSRWRAAVVGWGKAAVRRGLTPRPGPARSGAGR